MTNPAVTSTPKYPCVLQTLFQTKMNQVFLGKKFRDVQDELGTYYHIGKQGNYQRQPVLHEKDSAASGAGSQSMVKNQAVRAPVRAMTIL